MTVLDNGKFTRVAVAFHTLLAFDVFALFFTGYSVMFNDELWWLLTLLGGTEWVLLIHRLSGYGLILLVGFFVPLLLSSKRGRHHIKELVPSRDDVAASIQDLQFALGRADERHPNARQYAGYSEDEVPIITYIGKGVAYIDSVMLTLLIVSGLLIWNKTAMMAFFQTKAAAMAFVAFHGLLGVIMLMGIVFHIFEHGFHPAFYPIELKAFIPESETPAQDAPPEAERESVTGIERVQLRPSWSWTTAIAGAAAALGVLGFGLAAVFDYAYPIPFDLIVGGGPTSLALAIGVNLGVLVLLLGVVLTLYGNLLRVQAAGRNFAEESVGREPEAGASPDD
ncbi:cytochrome b/b6 domain-containing protein [Halopenitus sp. H-Gu1]|uniref:cytochrome b/b6 domain-containing protein n=1 Tax=Halopenitus sp. H-Gu1 TaxID=3242697 RepID=UPI00359D9D48